MKSDKEIRKMLTDIQKKLCEEEDYAHKVGTSLLPEVVSYKEGAKWALEWVLNKSK